MRVSDLFAGSRSRAPGRLAAALGIVLLGTHLQAVQADEDDAPPLAPYGVVHGFVFSEGAGPLAGLVQAKDGNFYGTTSYGGGKGNGIVFRLSPRGAFKVLHEFVDHDGLKPATGLTLGRKGVLFGLTSTGGRFGGGTAFKITTDGKFTVLHDFGGKSDDGGQAMYGRLVEDADGNFYGTQSQGGTKGFGTIFRMTPAGDVKVLHTFKGYPKDGAHPLGGLVRDSDGTFYGTTQAGGENDPANQGAGTIYRVTTGGAFKVLWNFAGGPNKRIGREPQSAPTVGRDGLLYGATTLGGKDDFGTVYRVKANGAGFETLHGFRGGVRAQPKNADGSTPLGQLLLAANGRLYGTTFEGGANDGPTGSGAGTIFEIDGQGKYSTLRALGDTAKDAAMPVGALIQADDKHLYGTTWAGGPETRGTVFQVAP